MTRINPLGVVRIQDAIEFSVRQHKHQYRRKTGVPYVIHPLEVVKQIAIWGVRPRDNQDLWIAAILHDVLEDCVCDPKEISDNFGVTVLDLVLELTHFSGQSKEDYLKSFRDKSPQANLIKVADRVCNLRDFALSDPKHEKGYYIKSRPFFEAFAANREAITRAFGKDVYDQAYKAIYSI